MRGIGGSSHLPGVRVARPAGRRRLGPHSGLSRPRSSRRTTRAGTVEAAATACSSVTPSRTGCGLRRGARRHSRQGSRRPAGRRRSRPGPRHRPACTNRRRPRPRDCVRHERQPAAGSVAGEEHGSSATWAPSAMSWTTTSRRARAAPTTPGSRWWNGRIALKRCVTVRAPRANARSASIAVASVCPSETVMLRSTSSSTSSSAPGAQGQRDGRDGAGVEQEPEGRGRARAGAPRGACRAGTARGTALPGGSRATAVRSRERASPPAPARSGS